MRCPLNWCFKVWLLQPTLGNCLLRWCFLDHRIVGRCLQRCSEDAISSGWRNGVIYAMTLKLFNRFIYSKAAKRLANHKALPALPALPIKKHCEAKQKSIKAMKTWLQTENPEVVRIWSADQRKMLAELPHQAAVLHVAWAPGKCPAVPWHAKESSRLTKNVSK